LMGSRLDGKSIPQNRGCRRKGSSDPFRCLRDRGSVEEPYRGRYRKHSATDHGSHQRGPKAVLSIA
jgi:hypothetical protein